MLYFVKFIFLINKGEFEIFLLCKLFVYVLLFWVFIVYYNVVDGFYVFYCFGLENNFIDIIFIFL